MSKGNEIHMQVACSIARVGGGIGTVAPHLELAAGALGIDALFGSPAARQVTEGDAPSALWNAFCAVVDHAPDPRVVPTREFQDPRLVQSRPRKIRRNELLLP